MPSSVPSDRDRESLEKLEAGGLPLATETRLQAQADSGIFSSQLSIDGFALCAPTGVVPLSQVMGSCVLHVGRHGYYPSPSRRRRSRARGAEIKGLSDGFNQARERAFGRLL